MRDCFGRFFSFVIVLIVSSVAGSVACGATDSQELEFPSTLQTLKTRTKKTQPPPPLREKSGFSFVLPSVVFHGIKPDKSVADEMGRKLDSDGRTVVTPGLGLAYEGEHGGLLALIAGFKDCYDGLAGTLQLGQVFKISRVTSWGYTLGLYVRETPMSCTTVRNFESVNGGPGRPTATRTVSYEECTEFDNYPIKSVAYVNRIPIDIIPMPFLHFSTALYKSEGLQIDLKFMSNFVLNEFGIGIPF